MSQEGLRGNLPHQGGGWVSIDHTAAVTMPLASEGCWGRERGKPREEALVSPAPGLALCPLSFCSPLACFVSSSVLTWAVDSQWRRWMEPDRGWRVSSNNPPPLVSEWSRSRLISDTQLVMLGGESYQESSGPSILQPPALNKASEGQSRIPFAAVSWYVLATFLWQLMLWDKHYYPDFVV